MTRFIHCLAALLILLPAPLAAAAPSLSVANYEVFADGFRIGRFDVRSKRVGGQYGVHIQSALQGVLGFLLRAKFDGRAEGRLDESGRPLPTLFSARSSRIFKQRDVTIAFQDRHPVSVTLTPLRDHTALSDPAKISGPIMDSVSYVYQLFHAKGGDCPVARALYDGRRRVLVRFEAPVPEANGLLCNGSYRIIEGPDHSLLTGQRSFPLAFHYSKEGGAPRKITVRARHNTMMLKRLP